MENNENLVTEVTEKVEQTTEQTPVKTYTQDEVNEMMGKRSARIEKKLRKEYDRKYGELAEVTMAGTGKGSVEEVTELYRDFYAKKGITLPKKPEYTDDDIKVLAKAEADDVIRSGYEDVVEEVDRLTELGLDNMTAREKVYFKQLAEHRQNIERQNELAKIGVTDEVYNSKEFQDFAGKFNPKTPIADIYSIYVKTQPKKDIKPMGSMKNTPTDAGVKEFYSYEEAKKFTTADFDKNPALYEAVKKSMTQW